MRIRFASVATAFVLFAQIACGDPIIVTGSLPGRMTRVAGQPNHFGDSLDSLAINTLLAQPRGIAVAEDGTLYIADTGNARIVAVTPGGRATVVASASGCTEACLDEPYAVALDLDGTLWIADVAAHRIFRLEPGGTVPESVVGTGDAASGADGAPAGATSIDTPAGIVIDEGGVVYFSERGGHRVRTIDPNGTLRTIAGDGTADYREGPATSAWLNGPAGLAVHGNTLYIADELNHRVRAVALADSRIRTVAGIGVAGYSETDSLAGAAKLNRPRAVAVGADGGQLFIADAANNMVRMVSLSSGRIARFAGTGDSGYTDEGLDAGDTSLFEPSGVAMFDGTLLFISDSGHHIVWRTPVRF